MLFKRTTIALALAAALLAVAPAAPAASADPIVSAPPSYDWGYYMGGGPGTSLAWGGMCWGMSMYFSYMAFCPTCVGAGIAGSGACMLGAWA
ncbi:MAG: hypothetical protein F4Y57_04380 [Acidobacteria bacterium]|nr:hypothetical protein [Acidobacteriota bacterium]